MSIKIEDDYELKILYVIVIIIVIGILIFSAGWYLGDNHQIKAISKRKPIITYTVSYDYKDNNLIATDTTWVIK